MRNIRGCLDGWGFGGLCGLSGSLGGCSGQEVVSLGLFLLVLSG